MKKLETLKTMAKSFVEENYGAINCTVQTGPVIISAEMGNVPNGTDISVRYSYDYGNGERGALSSICTLLSDGKVDANPRFIRFLQSRGVTLNRHEILC